MSYSTSAAPTRLDGVVLVGGPDVNPSNYGQVRGPKTEPASDGRDAFDLALARACVERDHPLLAVCRGSQVLNDALGGSLIQHLDDHMVREKYNDTVHSTSASSPTAWTRCARSTRARSASPITTC